MAMSSSRIAITRGCDPRITMAVRSFDAACSPSYTVTSKRWSVWRLVGEHIEPAVVEAFERRQPGYYTSWFGPGGLTRWMRANRSVAIADRRLKSLHRAVDERLKPSVETLRNLIDFVVGLQPKRVVPDEVKPLKGAPRLVRLRRAEFEPYCELCWRLSQRSEAIEREGSTYLEPLDSGGPTRWLSDRFCSRHDPKDPGTSYRRDLRYRDGLESAMRSLRQVVNDDPSFRAAIAGDDSNSKCPPDIRGLDLTNRAYSAFSPLVMRMRWHAYQIARHRPADSTISAVQLARQGHQQAEIARRLGLTPQAVSKALRQARGVFDFSMPRDLVWMPDPADAPDNPPYISMAMTRLPAPPRAISAAAKSAKSAETPASDPKAACKQPT